MNLFLGLIAGLIVFFLAVIHFYWAFGGTWGIASVLPTNLNEDKMLKPSWFASVLVGVILLFVALLYEIEVAVVSKTIFPKFIVNNGLYAVGGVFILRAIGDFKYVGFFKRIKGTLFAKNDTKYFSPLCLFLGIIAILLILNR